MNPRSSAGGLDAAVLLGAFSGLVVAAVVDYDMRMLFTVDKDFLSASPSF